MEGGPAAVDRAGVNVARAGVLGGAGARAAVPLGRGVRAGAGASLATDATALRASVVACVRGPATVHRVAASVRAVAAELEVLAVRVREFFALAVVMGRVREFALACAVVIDVEAAERGVGFRVELHDRGLLPIRHRVQEALRRCALRQDIVRVRTSAWSRCGGSRRKDSESERELHRRSCAQCTGPKVRLLHWCAGSMHETSVHS